MDFGVTKTLAQSPVDIKGGSVYNFQLLMYGEK